MKNRPFKSLTTEEFVESATMFYIDQKLEDEYTKIVDAKVFTLQETLLGIAAPGGLEKYIRDDPEALDNLTSLLNISDEKFKRVITSLRIEKGHKITGEWTLKRIREVMLERPPFMKEVCDLLSEGYHLEKYAQIIPPFYRDNFRIDASTLGRLANVDDVKRLVKRSLEGRYTNQLGDSYFNTVADTITSYCEHEGITYELKVNVPFCEKVMSVVIPNSTKPRVIFDITYGITTSSTQTRYADRAEKVAAKLRSYNEGKNDSEKIIFVNIIDGAGWVARQSDLSRLERCSHYLLNLKNLETVKKIIKHYILEIEK